MSKVDQNTYGMISNKNFFFHISRTSNLIEKIKRILRRIGAEIMEQFNSDNCHMVIIDNISIKTNDRKRKPSTPIIHKFKKLRLNTNQNNQNEDNVKSSIVHESFLNIVKEKGIKIKSIDSVWLWLNQYYKLLVEMDDPDDISYFNLAIDKHCSVRTLKTPALKILDPFGGTRPIFVENQLIRSEMWYESQHQAHYKVNCEIRDNRRSTGTSTKKGIRRSRDALYNVGYCECCHEKYQNLYEHLISECHARYTEDACKYVEIDKLCVTVDDISLFFNNREALWIRHKQTRQSLISQVPRYIPGTTLINKDSKVCVDSQKLVIHPEEKATVTQINDDSSSSDSSNSSSTSTSSYSTCSSSSSSNSSSSVSDCADQSVPQSMLSTPIAATRVVPVFKLIVSPDSVSADENHQAQISLHVSSVIDHLDVLSCHENIDNPDLSLISCRSTFSPKSPILEPRFQWCSSCHRNHVPWGTTRPEINDDNKKQHQEFCCQFSQAETVIPINADIDIIDWNVLVNFENIDISNEISKSNIADVLKVIEEERPNKTDNQDTDNIERIIVFSSDDDDYERDNSISVLSERGDQKVPLNEKNQIIISDCNTKRNTLLSSIYSQSDFENSSNETGPLLESLQNIDYKENRKFDHSFKANGNLIENIDQTNSHHNLISDNKQELKSNQLNSLSDYEDLNDENSRPIIKAVRATRTRKKSPRDQFPANIDDTRSPRRKSSIAANQGIINTNIYFTTKLDNTARALESSYKCGVYDPREIIAALDYSEQVRRGADRRSNTSNNTSKLVLRNRNT